MHRRGGGSSAGLSCLLLLAGCRGEMTSDSEDIDGTLQTLSKLYGPPVTGFVWSAVSIDLNGDGVPERVVILRRDQFASANSPTVSEADLRAGICCDGFAVLTKVDRTWWPVVYQWNDYGEHLKLLQVDCLSCPQLVDDGFDGRDRGVGFLERRWGWNDSIKDEFGAAIWDGSSKRIDDDCRDMSWLSIPLFCASWGK